MTQAFLDHSSGARPKIVQDDLISDGIVAMDYSEESRTITLGTAAGHLIRLNRSGEQLERVRGFDGIRDLRWSDVGTFGVATLDGGKFLCLDERCSVQWQVEVTGEVTALAISPFGSHVAFSTESSQVHVVTTDKKKTGTFGTPQRLDYLQFLHESPLLLGAAEYGHLCCHSLNGDEIWDERSVNHVGSLAVIGSGRRILTAGFNHGIQVLTGQGKLKGAFMVDGVPDRVVAASTKRRFAATTVENRLYWMNFDGEVVWSCDMNADPVRFMNVDPMGNRLIVATNSGRLLQLQW